MRNESWKTSTGVATSSVVTFCIHTEISAQLAFIDIWKKDRPTSTVVTHKNSSMYSILH